MGSFLISASSMLAIAVWFDDPKSVFMTYTFAMMLLWCTLMLLAFLFENGWKCWLLYGGATLVGMAVFFAGHYLR